MLIMNLFDHFGCDAYVWISRQQSRLDASSKMCIFLSYADGTK